MIDTPHEDAEQRFFGTKQFPFWYQRFALQVLQRFRRFLPGSFRCRHRDIRVRFHTMKKKCENKFTSYNASDGITFKKTSWRPIERLNLVKWYLLSLHYYTGFF